MDKFCIVCKTPLNGQKQMYCGNTCKQKHHYERVKTQTNTYHSQTIRSLKRKLKLLEMFGGRCGLCGYDKNIAALHFHHIDPKTKNFKLDARVLSNKNWESIIAEVSKCELLCSNCHAESHNSELTIDNVKKMIAGAAVE